MLRTASELAKRGHEVEIFTMLWDAELSRDGQLCYEGSPVNIKIHVLPQKGLFNYQRYQKFIEASFAQIKAVQFDYVFGYNRMPGLDAHFAADPCFIERAYQQRNFLYRLTPRFKWFTACEKAIFSADSKTEVLAVSLSEKAHFQSWYGIQNGRYHYIPPFLSPERFLLQDKQAMRQYLRNAFDFGEGDFVYLLTGSGFAMKGLDRAILALAVLPEALRITTRLVAVGQDNPKKFRQMAKRLGLENNVLILKGRPDIPQLMQGADVCIHPAYRENTGLVILEAMACGAPVLVTQSCGYAHHVADADAGIVHAMPFDQSLFNQQFIEMRLTGKKQQWSMNAIKYAKNIMQANDGSSEANILIELALQKKAFS